MSKQILKSRQANLDPEPYVDQHGIYRSPDGDPAGHDFDARFHYDPRPEFEPTRDKHPWAVSTLAEDDLPDFRITSLEALEAMPHFEKFDFLVEWAPRREQFDTPVNSVLAWFRENFSGHPNIRGGAQMWLESMSRNDWAYGDDHTPDEIDHARKVLTRLAEWSA